MALTIELTTDWSAERFAPYGAAITAAFGKLRDRFPREVTVENLFADCVSGKRQLWIILDGDVFVSFVLTEINTNDATGLKTLVIPSFAGDKGAECVPLIQSIEEFARDQGCDETMIWGRLGWKRPLAAEGYGLDLAIFRKAL